MRKTIMFFAALLSQSLTTANSFELLNPEYVPAKGMPFCYNDEEFKEMMTAFLHKDMTWAKTLKSCAIISAGQRIGIIQTKLELDGIRVVKVRVIGEKGSVVGTGIFEGDTSKPSMIKPPPSQPQARPKPHGPVKIEISP